MCVSGDLQRFDQRLVPCIVLEVLRTWYSKELQVWVSKNGAADVHSNESDIDG